MVNTFGWRMLLCSSLTLLGSTSALVHAQSRTISVEPAMTQTFDSRGHAKANGARVTVKYPSGWKAQEGSRPRAVQNFLGDYAGTPFILSLAIETRDEPVEAECAKSKPQDWLDAFPDNWRVTEARTVTRRGKPGAIIEVIPAQQRVGGFELHTRMRVLAVCHGRHIVKATCAASGDKGSIEAHARKGRGLCDAYFDSLRTG